MKAKTVIKGSLDANLYFKRIFEIAQELKDEMFCAKNVHDLDEATILVLDSLERKLITTQYYLLKNFVNDKDEYQKKFVESYEYLLAISRENLRRNGRFEEGAVEGPESEKDTRSW